jgi:protein-tyrosine sulfotransferase
MTEQPAYEGIIVMGAPRSGTTLLRRILNAHPDIACPGETNLLAGCARFLRSETIAEGVDVGVLSGLEFAGFSEDVVLAALREFAFGFHREYARRQGKSRWASKTAFDVFYWDLIERLCGRDAYFVCVQRHGLDVACSLKDLCETNGIYLSELHEYIKRYPRPLEAFCHAWVDITRATQAFVERHPDNALLLTYEDLTAGPESVTRKIADFVKVDWPSDWLAKVMQAPDHTGLGDWKTYAKDRIDTESVGRWRRLSEHTISMMGRICNPVLEASGYPPVPVKEERSAEEARRRYELGLKVGGRLRKRGADAAG